ncbi:hypothetical protein ACIQU6_39790 [Streptomyces sp. NPDC090442]|jgi:hypothetical protein|uniref:hypothetical protein n=1 Tax=Streptomyces sp. NPDC090442 TaxID=3365962 RepID=UPI0037F40861
MGDDDTPAFLSALSRLAARLRRPAWLRGPARAVPPLKTPPGPAAAQDPPSSRMRRQPEDDASIYPLF